MPRYTALFTKASPTDGETDGLTDGRTDRPSYRDARTHLDIRQNSTIEAIAFCMVSLDPEI